MCPCDRAVDVFIFQQIDVDDVLVKSALPDSFKTRQFDSLVEPSTPTSEIILQLAVFAVFFCEKLFFFLKKAVSPTHQPEREGKRGAACGLHAQHIKKLHAGHPPPQQQSA